MTDRRAKAAHSRRNVQAGAWVEVTLTILSADERATGIPQDTGTTPYVARVRGFLQADCRLDEDGMIRTLAGRLVAGRIVKVNPSNPVDFGRPIPELIRAGVRAAESLDGAD